MRTFLNYSERVLIQELLEKGFSHRKIARFLQRAHPTITREINRNSINGVYKAENAKKKAIEKNKNIPNRISSLEMQIEIILEKLQELYERNSKDK